MRVSAKMTENLERIVRYIEERECDFIVFPEMALTGYYRDFAKASAERAWEQIATACRQAYTTAIVGTGALDEGKAFIQARVFSHEGELLGAQDKLIPTENDRSFCSPGEGLNVYENEGLTFGCLNGNDFWVAPGYGPYPDLRLTRTLAGQGAQVIFHCNDTGIDPSYSAYYESNLKLRAREGGFYAVTVNAAAPAGALNVPSGVVSPEGEWLVKCKPEGEQVFSYDLNL